MRENKKQIQKHPLQEEKKQWKKAKKKKKYENITDRQMKNAGKNKWQQS